MRLLDTTASPLVAFGKRNGCRGRCTVCWLLQKQCSSYTTRKRCCLSRVAGTKGGPRRYVGKQSSQTAYVTGTSPALALDVRGTLPSKTAINIEHSIKPSTLIAVTRIKFSVLYAAFTYIHWSALQAHLERTFGTTLTTIARSLPSLVFSVFFRRAHLPVRIHIATPHILPRIQQVLLHGGQDGRLVLRFARR